MFLLMCICSVCLSISHYSLYNSIYNTTSSNQSQEINLNFLVRCTVDYRSLSTLQRTDKCYQFQVEQGSLSRTLLLDMPESSVYVVLSNLQMGLQLHYLIDNYLFPYINY